MNERPMLVPPPSAAEIAEKRIAEKRIAEMASPRSSRRSPRGRGWGTPAMKEEHRRRVAALNAERNRG
jgi:hypothetical protein